MIVTTLSLIAGVVLLAYAADQFVLGAARIALLRRYSSLLVGIVIIGFGTSVPELLVSAIAATRDKPEIAIGNIVGSNIANLSLLLGVGAVIIPIRVASRTVGREAPITVAATLGFAVAVQHGIDVVEGMILLTVLIGVLWWITRDAESSTSDTLGTEAEALAEAPRHSLGPELIRTALGLIGTVAGAQLLLSGAIDVADRAGLREGFVGATLVAASTSLPELVTVIQSARRQETDLIVGNLLGSNLFNALGVGGVVGLINTGDVQDTSLTIVAASAAILVSLLAWGAMTTARTVARSEGVVLIVFYAVLVALLT